MAAVGVRGDEKMWQNYQEQSKSVEIIYRGDEKQEILTRIYFPNDSNVSTRSEYIYNIFINRFI